MKKFGVLFLVLLINCYSLMVESSMSDVQGIVSLSITNVKETPASDYASPMCLLELTAVNNTNVSFMQFGVSARLRGQDRGERVTAAIFQDLKMGRTATGSLGALGVECSLIADVAFARVDPCVILDGMSPKPLFGCDRLVRLDPGKMALVQGDAY